MADFDKTLRDTLGDGERKPPAFVWDNIEQEIEPKKKRRGFFFFFGCLGTSLLLLSAIALYCLLPNSITKNQLLTETNLSKNSLILDSLNTLTKKSPLLAPPVQLSEQTASKNVPLPIPRDTNSTSFSETKDTPPSKLIKTIVKPSHPNRPVPNKETGTAAKTVYKNASKPTTTQKHHSEKPLTQKANNLPSDEISTAVPQINTKKQSPVSDIDGIASKEKDLDSPSNEQRNNTTKIGNTGIDSSIHTLTTPQVIPDSTNNIMAQDSLSKTTVSVDSSNAPVSNIDSLPNPLPPIDSASKEQKSSSKKHKFFVQAKVGYSVYTTSFWNATFEVGVLSRRSFPSSGLQATLHFGYEFNRWLNPILGFSVNAKQVSFNYSALYDDHGYFIHNIKGNLLPLAEINDVDYLCNKHLMKDIEAQFSVTSYALSIGNKFKLFQVGKFGLDLDIAYSLELNAHINIQKISKIEVSDYLSDHFNSRFNIGLNANYQLSNRFKLFIDMEYIFMPRVNKTTSLYQNAMHETISSLGLRFNF